MQCTVHVQCVCGSHAVKQIGSCHCPCLGPICLAFHEANEASVKHEDQIRNLKISFFAIHMTYSYKTRIFRKTGINKEKFKNALCERHSELPPNPDQNFTFIRSFYDTSSLLCAEEDCLYCEVVEHGSFPCLLFPWEAKCMYVPGCRLVQSHRIVSCFWENQLANLGNFSEHVSSELWLLTGNTSWYKFHFSGFSKLDITYLIRTACYH